MHSKQTKLVKKLKRNQKQVQLMLVVIKSLFQFQKQRNSLQEQLNTITQLQKLNYQNLGLLKVLISQQLFTILNQDQEVESVETQLQQMLMQQKQISLLREMVKVQLQYWIQTIKSMFQLQVLQKQASKFKCLTKQTTAVLHLQQQLKNKHNS